MYGHVHPPGGEGGGKRGDKILTRKKDERIEIDGLS